MSFDPNDPALRRRRPRPQLASPRRPAGRPLAHRRARSRPVLSGVRQQSSEAASGRRPLPAGSARPAGHAGRSRTATRPSTTASSRRPAAPSRSSTTPSYMAPGVMKAFGKKHGVSVQVTPYNNYDEMLAKIRQPGESFDLVFPGPSVLSKMVYTDLLQPLNHSYVPQPQERLAGVPGPVVRPRCALHRALHDLRHGRAVPHRPGDRRPRERLRPPLGQGSTPARSTSSTTGAKQSACRCCATTSRRHQHHERRRRREGDRLADRADRPGERQGQRQRLLRGPRGHRDRPPGLVRRRDRRPVLPAQGRDARGARLLAPRRSAATRHRQRRHRHPQVARRSRSWRT